MKRAYSSSTKWWISGALLGLASITACSGKVEPAASGDGDGDGDGDTQMMTGGTGGAMVASGGAPAGGTGGSMGGAGTGGVVENPLALPDLLSETGLYEADMTTLAPGVRPFRPQFKLWTDGATKRRWIYLPEGEQIDTSDMDYWELPIGTKLWKEFTRPTESGDVRVETRLLERKFNGVWVMVAYQWRDDLSDADKVQAGVQNASGTEHDIPSEEQCWECHNKVPGRSIGFSAIQLAHDAGADIPGTPEANEWTLDQLQTAGLLSDAPPVDFGIPDGWSDEEKAALGYLHVNCGHCHHPLSSVSGRVDMELWLTVAGLASGNAEDTRTYQTAVNVAAALPADVPGDLTYRIEGGTTTYGNSIVYARFNTLGEPYSMPTLGTEIVDPEGIAALEAWIPTLPAPPVN